jgi:hypothetical protein
MPTQRELTVEDIAGISKRFGLSVQGRKIRGPGGRDLTQDERDLALAEGERLRNSPPPVPGQYVMPGGGQSQQSTIGGDPVPDVSRDEMGMERTTTPPPSRQERPRISPLALAPSLMNRSAGRILSAGKASGTLGLGLYPVEPGEGELSTLEQQWPGYEMRFSEDRPMFMSNEKWDSLSSRQKLDNILTFGGHTIAAMAGFGEAGHQMVENPKTALATSVVAPGGAAKPAWNLARKYLLPNKANAGPIFEFILGKAKESPIVMDKVIPVLNRLKELNVTGGGQPRAVKALLKRYEQGGGAHLTYGEARDFYSNITALSGRYVDKAGVAVSNKVVAEVHKLRQALSDDIMSGLESVSKSKTGVGDLAAKYQGAMKTYAKGAQFDEKLARLGKFWQSVMPYTVGATIAGGIGAGAKTLGEFLGIREPTPGR